MSFSYTNGYLTKITYPDGKPFACDTRSFLQKAMDDFSLGSLTDTTIVYYDFSGFTWAPQVNAAGGGNAVDVMAALRDKASEFFEWLEDWVKIRERGRYDTCTVY